MVSRSPRIPPPTTLDSILVKPAGPDCNLACAYCFYRPKAALFSGEGDLRMRDDILEATMRQIMTGGGKALSIGWQGGEPTLMGLSFFERAVELQKKWGAGGQSVGNGLQTNGLLLDERWARFLRRYSFLVGISLDGPRHVHDRYRTTVNKEGSWQRTEDRVKLLLDHRVSVNALSVVTDYAAIHASECYDYLKAIGLTHQQYIPCVEPPPALSTARADFSVTPEAYGDFLCELFDRWVEDFDEDAPTTSIRFFDAVLADYLGETPSDCTLLRRCGIYLVVEHNGDVFPCDFHVTRTHRLGNVLDTDLQQIFRSPAMVEFGSAKQRIPKVCRACEWRQRCRGGCPKDRPSPNGTVEPSYFCPAYRQFFSHSHTRFEAIGARLRSRRAAAARASVVDALRKGKIAPGRNDPCPCGSNLKFKKCCLLRLQDSK